MFSKRGDRWSHQVVIGDGPQETLLLSSLEGDSQQVWPPSPPLQDLDRHELPDGAAVLAVGMAGTSHWSASFSIQRNAHPPEQSGTVIPPANWIVLVELACFCKGLPPQSARDLVSSYQIEPGVVVADDENGSIRLTLNASSFCLAPLSGEGWTSRLECVSSQLTISAGEIKIQPGKPTRWGFRLSSHLSSQ